MAVSTTAARRPGVAAVHSVNRFVLSVPSLDDAQRFYDAFGLDVKRNEQGLELRTFGSPHQWGAVHAGPRKQLDYLVFGMFADDANEIRRRIGASGSACEPHPRSDGKGVWVRDPDGLPLQIVVAENVCPSCKPSPTPAPSVAPGMAAAPARSKVQPVKPRRMSHVLRFTPDVKRMIDFYSSTLGLRLSDHSGDIIAFMHAPHGSDHHVVAFAKSDAPGLHHTSWDVGSIEEVGLGSEQMRVQGYADGWGVGRHVLGSNYFYYVRDPWKGWCEYSFDIDYIPADVEWRAADHPAEDSIYVWGPPMHPEFIDNHEARQ
ncbi:MAG TPA: VOC family protein [Casimicrobiaceae bacterium]|nr:VOC family protein [Casimicrobiaceae bacterium]